MDMRAVLDKIAESLEGDISIEPDWLSEHVGERKIPGAIPVMRSQKAKKPGDSLR